MRNLERDLKVVSFINQALNSQHQVIHHRDTIPDSLKGGLRDCAFEFDEIYGNIFSDSRVQYVVTTPLGMPLPDNRPENIELKDWEELINYFIKDGEFKSKFKYRNASFFIGGALERCLANAIVYHAKNLRLPEEKIYYVPELCVIYDDYDIDKVKAKFTSQNIDAINYEDAINMLSE